MSGFWDTFIGMLKGQNAQITTVPVGQGPDEHPARTYISPTDSYQDEIGFSSSLENHAPGGMRPMWQVYDQQQASVPSTVLTSSGAAKSNALAAIQGGIALNPRAPATTWAAVPQMIQNVRATGPIMIQANVSVRSTVASDQAAFAIYRDGQLIGNHVTHTLPSTVSAVAMIQLSAMDNPPSGSHLYAMYWSPGTGTLVAHSNQRNMFAINLTPQ